MDVYDLEVKSSSHKGVRRRSTATRQQSKQGGRMFKWHHMEKQAPNNTD